MRGFLLLASLLHASSVPPPHFVARPVPELRGLFNLDTLPPPPAINCGRQWLGADVAKSIRLPPASDVSAHGTNTDTYLWLWGDTLIGDFNGTYRNWTTMPRNSVGLLSISGNGSVVNRSFHWGHYKMPPSPSFSNDLAGPLFQLPYLPDPVYDWLWIVSGVALGPVLQLVAYHCTSNNETWGCQDSQLITVHNMHDPPEQWNYSVMGIPHSDINLTWGLAVVQAEPWIYLFGKSMLPHLGVVLLRIPTSSWRSHVPSFTGAQYFCGNLTDAGVWRATFRDRWSLKLLSMGGGVYSASDGFPDSIMYHEGLQRWYGLVTQSSKHTNINISLARRLEGPWTTTNLYDIPAPQRDNESYLVYATVAHPELLRSVPNGTLPVSEGDMLFSYVANTIDPDRLHADIDVYIPNFVHVSII
jgi:hypothetical protein